jgi:hypothetical protein
MSSLETAQSQVLFAYTTALGEITHSIDGVTSYISLHPVKIYADGTKFREASQKLLESVRSEVLALINDSMTGFNTRIQNSSIDYNQTITSADESTAFSEYIKTYSDKLSTAIDVAIEKMTSIVQSHLTSRPLMRATGNRVVPNIVLDGITTIKYEFINVGSKTWTGWMCLKVIDEYKKVVSVDFAPPQLPIVAPGSTVMLSREIKIDKIQYVSGNPRTWGKKSKISVSLYTRGV